MRADRLLSIMLLLQARGRLTARELAERLEVSERTIHRDMAALSGAGVPVYAERGASGGWAMLDDYRTDLTGLNEEEIQALVLAAPPRVLDDLGLRRAADGALIKLLAALPAISRRGAEDARQRIHVDTSGWRRSEESAPCLPTVQDAVWQGRTLRLIYHKGDEESEAVERLVDPLGLVAKGAVWYLVAAVAGEPRAYRVSRISAATLCDRPCMRPPGFDLAAYWAKSSAAFTARLPRYPMILRVAPDVLPRLEGAARATWARVECVGLPEADGWSTAQVLGETEEEACALVLRFGAGVEVVEPTELRQRVTGLARGISDFYDRT